MITLFVNKRNDDDKDDDDDYYESEPTKRHQLQFGENTVSQFTITQRAELNHVWIRICCEASERCEYMCGVLSVFVVLR